MLKQRKTARVSGFERTILVLFGITGDLAQKKILPSLYHLEHRGMLPEDFRLVGMARRDISGKKLEEFITAVVAASPFPQNSRAAKNLAKKISFVQGDATQKESYDRLAAHIASLEQTGGHCANRLFYFATLPSLYLQISGHLKKSGLLASCGRHKREMRIVIEKPFGRDLASAAKLDRQLSRYFSEAQIYRMDHYLGKETVQNIFATRFANSIFEPVWNRQYIDHVQISGVLETAGIKSRGTYYEEAGAMRDVVQNHLMQLVALIAMEKPADLSPAKIWIERARVLKSIKIWQGRAALDNSVRGQYGPGKIGTTKVVGYREEGMVSRTSMTETFAALKLFIDNERWRGVPFYLRTGLRMARSFTEISLHFKPVLQGLFTGQEVLPNVLTFRIQPNESIHLRVMAKHPGFGVQLKPVDMELGYHEAFAAQIPEAYERLLLDFFQGDQRLFASSEEIEASWKFITPILEAWQAAPVPHFPNYSPGSFGPKESEALIRRDGRKWWLLEDKV